jgi:hypothetical protein
VGRRRRRLGRAATGRGRGAAHRPERRHGGVRASGLGALPVRSHGQGTTYAETVDPDGGAHRPVARAQTTGFIGTDLSADGSTILGETGGFDPLTRHDAVAIPYGGGAPRLLVRGASHPDWNR